MKGRSSLLGITAAMAAIMAFEPSETHQIGPGERKSPARGVRLEVDCPKPKKKSASLKKLLRK